MEIWIFRQGSNVAGKVGGVQVYPQSVQIFAGDRQGEESGNGGAAGTERARVPKVKYFQPSKCGGEV